MHLWVEVKGELRELALSFYRGVLGISISLLVLAPSAFTTLAILLTLLTFLRQGAARLLCSPGWLRISPSPLPQPPQCWVTPN